jgi:hypothetical protein
VSICLVDTSILCEILEVPKLCRDSPAVLAELDAKVRRRESLLLPMSSILETGNHVGQVGDGRQRRAAAEKFIALIQQAIRGETPSPRPLSSSLTICWLGWKSFPTGRREAPAWPT